MKKKKIYKLLIDLMLKIIISFSLIFILYLLSKKIIVSYSYTYFIFPSLSIIIVFICGVNVGKTLERIRNNDERGFFIKNKSKNNTIEDSEYIISDTRQIITNKKILRQLEEGEKVHVKIHDIDIDDNVFKLNYDEEKESND